MTEKELIWHCNKCGYEWIGGWYNFHPKRCPECKCQRWQSGKTAKCELCEIYSICHELYKGTCPTYRKTCLYFTQTSP